MVSLRYCWEISMTVRRQFIVLYALILAFTFSAKADEKLIELVKKTKRSVVLIQTFDRDNKPLSQGSGFFINNKGHIVTNCHVLEDAFRATIKTSSGLEYPVEGIIAKNADADIVKLVVNIQDANIPFLNLSETIPSEGQDVIVIGNPLGLESTVSSGIVSAVRDIPAFGKILQITAPVSPGSSGSPVLNNKGEVIGIATLIVTKGQNLNFAIPSDKIIALKESPQTSLTNAIPSDLNDAQQFYQKGLKELWQENWSSALTFFQKAKEKNPQDANVWFHVGYCYSSLGQYQDAIEAYKQATIINPDFAEAYYNLGIDYRLLGSKIGGPPHFTQEELNQREELSWKEFEAFKHAIRIKPNWAEAHYNFGVAYGALGRHEDSIEAYKQAIRIKPDFAVAHFNLGIAYLLVGDKGSALEEYKILKTLDAEKANKLFNLIYE
jgi:Flp pilus assembly protein TadD